MKGVIIQKLMDIIEEKFSSKIMKIYFVADENLIYIEFLLRNLTEDIAAWDIIEGYVIRFDSIKKGRLILAIDLDLEEKEK